MTEDTNGERGCSLERVEQLRNEVIAARKRSEEAKRAYAEASAASQDAQYAMWKAAAEAEKAAITLMEYMGIPKGYV